MATFTVTTGNGSALPGSATNIDTLSGRAGGDTYNVNGGFLLIDEDSRYGVNANTSATIGTLTPSATRGGSVMIDGRASWLVPFSGGSGVVPAFGAAISKGGASGKCQGVYAALNAAPLAAGAAMPATGWLKLKQWNGVLFGSSGALTGITANVAAGENVGWIEVVAQEGTLCLISSLNQTPVGNYDGSFCKGDWYTLGTTTGSRATTYQVPTNGSLVWHGGVMVDKSPATAITGASWAAGVLTVVSPAHGLATDDRVMIDLILPRSMRTVDTQRCTVIDANTFSVPMAVSPGVYISGGTVAAQEWYPTTDSTNLKVGPESYRGKFCWLDSTTGLLTFGNDGVTSTGGYCPGAGLVVRMPNVMTANATSAAKTVNSLAAAPATRWRYYNGAAGTVRVDHMSGTFSPSVFQTGKAVQMSDCSVVGNVSLSSQSAPCSFTNLCLGGNAATTMTATFTISSMYQQTTLLDCTISSGEMGAKYPVSLSTAYGVTADRCRLTGTGDRTAQVYSVNGSIGSGASFTRCQHGPHSLFIGSQYSLMSMSNGSYYSAAYGVNQIANPAPWVSLSNLSADFSVTDFTFLGSTPLARSSMLTAASGSDRPLIRNCGTFAAPIEMRLNGYQQWMPWTRVTTTATITENGHPYRVGDQCFIYNSSATGTVSLSAKTITAVTANTFDVAAVNTGPTSGTCSYYVGCLANVFVLSGVKDAKIQNVHVRGNTASGFTTTTTQYGAVMENVSVEPRSYNVMPSVNANNFQARSLMYPDYPIISQQSSVFGSHFTDAFVREPGSAVPGQAAPAVGATWSRSGTTATVTFVNHGITGNNERIWVENSSAPATIANGWGASAATLVVTGPDTFTFACANTGPTTGTLDYRLMGDSVFRVLMNEASALTASQAVITSNAGAAGFTGAGTLVLPAAGDQCTWTMDTFIMGYEGFAFTPTIPYGSSLSTFAQTQAFDIAYRRDDGAGFGPWRNAILWKATGAGTAGQFTITVASTSGVGVGDYVTGVGIGTGAKVQSVDTATQLTLTVANAAAVSGTIGFWWTPNESAFLSTGVRFQWRMTANTANVAAAYEIDVPLLSSNTSRARLYDQRTQYTLTFTGLVPGSDIRIVTAGTVTSLLDADAVAGSTYAYTYYYAPGTTVDIQVLKDGYRPFRYQGYALGAANASFLVQQQVARNEGV